MWCYENWAIPFCRCFNKVGLLDLLLHRFELHKIFPPNILNFDSSSFGWCSLRREKKEYIKCLATSNFREAGWHLFHAEQSIYIFALRGESPLQTFKHPINDHWFQTCCDDCEFFASFFNLFAFLNSLGSVCDRPYKIRTYFKSIVFLTSNPLRVQTVQYSTSKSQVRAVH
jgi:hypothetical protein